jgi:hypothetical protein
VNFGLIIAFFTFLSSLEGMPWSRIAHTIAAVTRVVVSELTSGHHASAELRYQCISTDPRFSQFANIPERIIRCLNFLGLDGDEDRIRAALLAYYTFIGVTDDVIDGGANDSGERILACLENPSIQVGAAVMRSDAEFMAEILKVHCPLTTAQQIRRKFRTLYRINLKERRVRNRRDFVKTRKILGSVTADISYLLIRDHLRSDAPQLRRLMKQVGAVGCLVDSVIDVRHDQHAGLLAFRPSLIDWLYLGAQTVVSGVKVVLTHPRLVILFLEAVIDNVRDRKRAEHSSTVELFTLQAESSPQHSAQSFHDTVGHPL